MPWQAITQQTGVAVLWVAPVDDDGNLLMNEFEKRSARQTRCAATQVSNALGTIALVQQIVEPGHRYGAQCSSTVRSPSRIIPIDVQAWADFFVFRAQEIFGPLASECSAPEEALADTPPYQLAANMIADVTLERAIYQGILNKVRGRHRATSPTPSGLGEAIRYVERSASRRIAAYEHAARKYAIPAGRHPGGTGWSAPPRRRPVLSFVLAGHETAGRR